MVDSLIKYMPIINYKHDNIKHEFEDDNLDFRVKIIVYALAGFAYYNFGKSLTITEIFRTQEMQDAYYKDDPIYNQKPFFSVHQLWRAVDVSVKYFTDSELEAIKGFLEHIEYGKIGLKTGLIHNIGMGEHIHIQVSSNNYTSIKNLTLRGVV